MKEDSVLRGMLSFRFITADRLQDGYIITEVFAFISNISSNSIDTDHNFDHAKRQILSFANSWTARLFEEAWLTCKN